jgi:hypothetical protein
MPILQKIFPDLEAPQGVCGKQQDRIKHQDDPAHSLLRDRSANNQAEKLKKLSAS